MLQYYISLSTRNLNHGFREEQMQDMQSQTCLQINNTFLYEYFMNKSSTVYLGPVEMCKWIKWSWQLQLILLATIKVRLEQCAY